MARGLTYADAVRLLGGDTNEAWKAFDLVTGIAALAGAIAFPSAVLGWLDARNDFVRISRELWASGLRRAEDKSRLSRTQRLQAAHAVIVVCAFFEALQQADLPFRFGDLKLDARDMSRIVTDQALDNNDERASQFVELLLDVDRLLPEADTSAEAFENHLHSHYQEAAHRLISFIEGLVTRDRLNDTQWARFVEILELVPDKATERYRALLRQLAAEFGEVAFWVNMREHQATRSEVRSIEPALVRLERLLVEFSSGAPADERRIALHRIYSTALERAVITSGEEPDGISVPTLGKAHIPPSFREAPAPPSGEDSGDERFWSSRPIRTDIEGYLVKQFTKPRALEAPILILGQPGAGKSVLMRVLAARLPPGDYVPVLVTLREVSATLDPLEQIEQALRAALNERVQWRDLVNSGKGALPVVMLDGFDELMQATGVRQSDYLAKVASFQQRESDRGGRVAVIVTSRSSVTSRTIMPSGTSMLRLEPFSEAQIEFWLDLWNQANATNFARLRVKPLPSRVVLHHGELAKQPLLLLMLALYDAVANALQELGTAGGGDRLLGVELYERLLRDFAQREVEKSGPRLSGVDMEEAVEWELRRLAVVAFAMLNRSAQWVTEDELSQDLAALNFPMERQSGHDFHTPLAAGERALGRFFFVHRARALRDGKTHQAYEFLHATFGEYLVARMTWRELLDVAAKAEAVRFSTGDDDDERLNALLSFSTLSVRSSTMTFLRAMASPLPVPKREALTRLLIRLHRAADRTHAAGRLSGYQPKQLGFSARHARYSANLVSLAAVASGGLTAVQLFAEPVSTAWHRWHSEALLWHSRLTEEEFNGLLSSLRVERSWTPDGDRDLVITIDDGRSDLPENYMTWLGGSKVAKQGFGLGPGPTKLRQLADFQVGELDDVLLHTLEPILASDLASSLRTFSSLSGRKPTSALHSLLEVWLLSSNKVDAASKVDAYLGCIHSMTTYPHAADTAATIDTYVTLMVNALAADREASVILVLAVLKQVKGLRLEESARAAIDRCVHEVLNRAAPDEDGYDELILFHTDDPGRPELN